MGIKLLLISDHYPPFIGGAHRQTQLLAKELARRGHDVTVATVWHPGTPAVEDDDGVMVYRFRQLRTWLPGTSRKPGQRHQTPFPDPVTTLAVRQLIKRIRPDLIHAYGWFSYSCAAALTGLDIPLMISARDYGYSCATRTLVYRGQELCDGPEMARCLGCAAQLYGRRKGWAAALGLKLSNGLLRRKLTGVHSISTYVQTITRRDFTNDEEGSTPYAEVIIPSFREEGEDEGDPGPEVRRILRQLPDEPFIMFVGALRLVKGLESLLAAYVRLEAPPPLVLIGTREFDTPRDFPPGVVILESLPHAAVMAAWERALFGAIPSLWPEPLGSVVYEGMSRGKAVIGTTPGGHADMITDMETGLLVPAGDVDALTRAMSLLLRDDALRQKLGAAALARARDFSAAVNVPRFEQFYQELIDTHHGSGRRIRSVESVSPVDLGV